MAITTDKSTQLTNTDATPSVALDPSSNHGRKRYAYFDFTKSGAGDAGSTCETVRLPAGKVRLFLLESLLNTSALGASRTMDTGWQAYTDQNGDAVVADPNGLDDGVDVSSAAVFAPTGTIGGDETKLFQSISGVTIEVQVNDGTWDDAETLSGYFAYMID